MQRSEYARFSWNAGVKSGMLCTALLVRRIKEPYFQKERARKQALVLVISMQEQICEEIPIQTFFFS